MARHLVPDLVLLGFVDDMLRNGEVVLTLAERGSGDLSYPSARTAFEAGQHALLLTIADNYDLAGARAWVYFARKDFAAIEQAEEAYGELPVEPPDEHSNIDLALEEMQSHWEAFSPGQGSWIVEAAKLVSAKRQRPDNWIGAPIASELKRHAAKLGQLGLSGPKDLAAMYNGTYAVLTRESHPRNRFKPRQILGPVGGPVRFVLDPPDTQLATTPVRITAGALLHGAAALMARSQLVEVQ